ncbi:MAG: divergent polysaccharide deacetylase family protein [Nitrospirae bacterium]|nr:divergent polysaccharide deacetylase family protein [Nitrospirota bacterium]
MGKRKKKSFRTIFLTLVILFICFLLVMKSIEKAGRLNKPSHLIKPQYGMEKGKTALRPEKKRRDQIAILIDDLGPDLREFHRLRNIHPNLSFAILPFQTYSNKIAREIQSNGHHDLLLHLPMEAESSVENPGKGAIYQSMNPDEIIRQVRLDLQAIPDAQGVNNHMGSKITSDESKMRIILNEIKTRNLYFVDSRTTSSSIAYSLAEKMGIRAAERQVFLDDIDREKEIGQALEHLVHLAHQNGSAIAIGHPRQNTIRALKRFLTRVDVENVELVPLSTLLR